MRLRLLAFLPLAAAITFLILLSASSLVSALERSFTPGEDPSGPVVVTRFETVCKGLFHELHVLSHEVTACAEQSPCDGSPLLCPTALDGQIDHEYQRLRAALHERCGYPFSLIDYARQGPRESIIEPEAFAVASLAPEVSAGIGVERVTGGACDGRHDWWESAMSGAAEPARYYF